MFPIPCFSTKISENVKCMPRSLCYRKCRQHCLQPCVSCLPLYWEYQNLVAWLQGVAGADGPPARLPPREADQEVRLGARLHLQGVAPRQELAVPWIAEAVTTKLQRKGVFQRKKWSHFKTFLY